MTRFQQGIIIGWFIGSIIDFILKEFDYYGIFEALTKLPSIIYDKGLNGIIGRCIDSFVGLILLDHKLNKAVLSEHNLDSILYSARLIRKEVEEKKTRLNFIKRLTMKNIDDMIETIELYRVDFIKEEKDEEIRPPSLDGLGIAVQEMMDMKNGRKEKVFVERVGK